MRTVEASPRELKRLRRLIQHAKTEREFNHLAMEAESRMLGETVIWASRRSFTSV